MFLVSLDIGGHFEGERLGLFNGLNSNSAVRASSIVSVLKKLRNGEIEKAIQHLELKLDNEIINHGLWLETHPNKEEDKWYAEKTDFSKKSMIEVFAYRKNYPRKYVSTEIKSQIEKVVKEYSE